MTHPPISVVLASYNGALHIGEQLDSIANQSLPPVEVIVSDDGSNDATIGVVNELAARSKVPVILLENRRRLGYAENFLQAAMRARGELIAFADQDDVWLPHKLERAVVAFRNATVMLWSHASRVVDEQLRPWPDRRFHTGLVKRAARADPFHPLHGSHSVFRADQLRYLPPVNRPCSVYGLHPAEHDEWIKFASLVLGRVAWDGERLMLHRRHGTAVTQDDPILTRHQVIRGREERYVHAVEAARQRAQYLDERAAAPECAPVREQLLEAASIYRQLVPRLARRVAARQAQARVLRARSLVAGMTRGDYRGAQHGGLGLWALAQDLYNVVDRPTRSSG
jgi:Glycosyl transferase family 2